MAHLTAFSTFFDDLDDDLDSCTVNVCGLVEHCSGVGGGGDCGSGVWQGMLGREISGNGHVLFLELSAQYCRILS